MSRRSPGLDAAAPEAEAELHPDDATRLGVADGDLLRVTSRRGSVVAAARLTRRSAPGMVCMAFHLAESATIRLTSDAVDPTAKIPEYEVGAVRVERLPAPILQGELTPQ